MFVCRDRTWNAFSGTSSLNGVQGYHDLVSRGLLSGAGLDLPHLRTLFALTGITMIGLQPEYTRCGSNRALALCAFSNTAGIIYATVAAPTSLDLNVPGTGTWSARCFDVHTGSLSVRVTINSGAQSFACPVNFVLSVPDRVVVLTHD